MARLDARVSRELVTSIFLPDSPIHDGALIIQNGRITAAGCFLPLTANPNVSKTLGTRHRAAIGLTEETDAVAIVVSEEDGTISLAREGRITRDVDGATLRTAYTSHDWTVIVAVHDPRGSDATKQFTDLLQRQLEKTPPTVRE